ERGDHPERVPPVAPAVDGCEGEQEEHVVEGFRIGDVVEAQVYEGEQLGHGRVYRDRESSTARARAGWVGCHAGLIASARSRWDRAAAVSPVARSIMPAW